MKTLLLLATLSFSAPSYYNQMGETTKSLDVFSLCAPNFDGYSSPIMLAYPNGQLVSVECVVPVSYVDVLYYFWGEVMPQLSDLFRVADCYNENMGYGSSRFWTFILTE